MNALEVDKITKTYGAREILSDISFKVTKGNIHGFLGPNGAGKTTTMRLIAKLLKPDSGQIKINGLDIDYTSCEHIHNIGFLLEDPPLFKDMRVIDYLRFVGQLKKVAPKNRNSNIDYAINALDLSSVANRTIDNLSRGFKQRVGIAQTLVHKPEILILDEPTIGLDPHSVVEVRNLILNLKNDHTILLSSHLLYEMSLVCDELTIINHGKILISDNIKSINTKLDQGQEIHLLLTKVTTPFYNALNEMKKFHSIVTKENPENGIKIILKKNDTEELRSELIKLTIEHNCNLLEIYKKEFTLEDLFLKITDAHD